MKLNITIQVKALLLMIVFSFSTILSFACSLGIDMWYNSGHHAKKNSSELIKKCCDDDAVPKESNEEHPEESDDCCTKSVIDFQLMTKFKVQQDIDFSTPLIYAHNHVWALLFTTDQIISSEMKWAVFRTLQLPPPDIRVSIRSFQI